MYSLNVNRLLVAVVITSAIAALYCIGGIIQAASLFTDERAQRNYELWGSLFLLFAAIFIGFGVTLALRIWRQRLHARSESKTYSASS